MPVSLDQNPILVALQNTRFGKYFLIVFPFAPTWMAHNKLHSWYFKSFGVYLTCKFLSLSGTFHMNAVIIRTIYLLRIHHWVKNLFIFIPVFFAGHLLQFETLVNLATGFFSFCLISSAVYVLNDLKDRESDQNHPTKKHRPIQSGKVKPGMAIFVALGVLVAGFGLALLLPDRFLYILLTYLVLNILYTLYLKRIPILDITIVSTGFLLRIFAGGVIGEVEVSKWLVLLAFFLSMILALAKRRDDLVLQQKGINNRPGLHNYSLQFVDISLGILIVIACVSFIMYTFSPDVAERLHSDYLYLTSILVVLGFLRYLQLTLVFEDSASPVKILYKDRFLQVVVLLWIGVFTFILYLS